MDDMGYADIGPFGATAYPTPNLDRMAKEGRKFTDFYVTQAVCSASRAGLLTGCYNVRIGILGALGPQSRHGINPNEVTIADLYKQKGYATACYGKWHLGTTKSSSPYSTDSMIILDSPIRMTCGPTIPACSIYQWRSDSSVGPIYRSLTAIRS